MEALSKLQLLVWSKPLPAFNTFIGGAGEDYSTAALLSTAMSIPPEAIQRFTVDENFNIYCRIDRDYSMGTLFAFSNYNGKKMKGYYIDLDARCTNSASGDQALNSNPNLKLRLLGLTIWRNQFNAHGSPNLVFIPSCTTTGTFAFNTWRNGVNRVYAPLLTTVGSNFLQNYNTNPISSRKNIFYIHSSMVATFTGGGRVLRIVTNYDTPNKVTDLTAIVDVYDVKLTFTTPTAGTNPIDFYEVWFQKVGEFRPERKYLPSDAEIKNSNDYVQKLEPNTQYSMYICTVDTMYNGSGMFKDAIKRAVSNEISFTTLPRNTSPISAGCSAYYKLATNSNDSSGNSRNGTDTSMTYASGYAKFGTGYVDVADNDALSFTDGTNDTSCHIAFGFIWNTKTGLQFFLNKRNQNDNLEWQVFANDTNLIFNLFTGTSNNIRIEILKSAISTGVLHTLQFSYNGSKNHTGIKAYLNAVSIGTTAMTGTYTGHVNGTSRLRIGATNWDDAFPLKADMKELAIWKNRTMTPTEITDIDYRIKNNIPLI